MISPHINTLSKQITNIYIVALNHVVISVQMCNTPR